MPGYLTGREPYPQAMQERTYPCIPDSIDKPSDSPINDALSRVDQEIASLHKQVSLLEARLSGVLQGESASCGEKRGDDPRTQPSPPQSPLKMRFVEEVESLTHVNRRISSILTRLEV